MDTFEKRIVVKLYLLNELKRFESRILSEYEEALKTNMWAKKGNDSQTAFGQWLGLARGEISWYTTGARLPTEKQADCIAARLGPKIYELCEYSRRMPVEDADLTMIVDSWPCLSEKRKSEIAQLIRENTGESREVTPALSMQTNNY